MTDRELTGDEAQRALSEAMWRTLATVPAPSPAELIAFVRAERDDAIEGEYDSRVVMFSALLTVLEGRRQDDKVRLAPVAPTEAADRPHLRVVQTQAGFFRVTVQGPDELQELFSDGGARYAVMEIARADTKDEALALARAWFAGLRDDTPRGVSHG